MVETLEKLFQDSVKDLYNAEKQFLKGMNKMVKAAESEELKQAIQKHIGETETQIERLEKVAESMGIKPTGKVCKAAQGLIEEANEHLEEVKPGPVLDAAIIVCSQKNEHYEICSYGTLISWAEQLGLKDVIKLLNQTLTEEKAADESLTQVAEQTVNSTADSGMEKKASVR